MVLSSLPPRVLDDPNFNPHEYALRTDPDYRRKYNEILTERMFRLIEAMAIRAGLDYDLTTGEVLGLTDEEKEKLSDPGVLLGWGPSTVKEFRPKHQVTSTPTAGEGYLGDVYVGPNNPVRSERVGEEVDGDVFKSDDVSYVRNPGEAMEENAVRDLTSENNAANAAAEQADRQARLIEADASKKAAAIRSQADAKAQEAAEAERAAAVEAKEKADKEAQKAADKAAKDSDKETAEAEKAAEKAAAEADKKDK